MTEWACVEAGASEDSTEQLRDELVPCEKEKQNVVKNAAKIRKDLIFEFIGT